LTLSAIVLAMFMLSFVDPVYYCTGHVYVVIH
jgi:hypothetical protein